MLPLLLACAAPAPVPVEAPMTAPCVLTWTRDSGASLLAEQRASGAAGWSDFATLLRAAPIDDAHFPVAHTARFQVAGRPVVWFTPDRTAVVVDAALFGDLAVVDATSIAAGTTAAVGTVTPAARAALGDRGVVELLVEADVVRIYAHIGGELCLREETTVAGAYMARFAGEHVYFTNDENHAPLAFDVTIAADGAISVAGR